MKKQMQNEEVKWRNPIPNALLNLHKSGVTIEEIIERESRSWLEKLQNSKPSLFSSDASAIPIEAIVDLLGIEIREEHRATNFGATTIRGRNKFAISLKAQPIGSYYYSRFFLAHEIGHICLRQAAGPLNFDEIAETKDSNFEEELLCDVFARALLLPREEVLKVLASSRDISSKHIDSLGKQYKVPRAIVLRRIADIWGSILLFWDTIQNPLDAHSVFEHRVTSVYKPIKFYSRYFVPRYFTSSKRFMPDLIRNCIEQKRSKFGDVRIQDIGDIPNDYYSITNVWFQDWNKNLLADGIVESRRTFYDMVTFLHLL